MHPGSPDPPVLQSERLHPPFRAVPAVHVHQPRRSQAPALAVKFEQPEEHVGGVAAAAAALGVHHKQVVSGLDGDVGGGVDAVAETGGDVEAPVEPAPGLAAVEGLEGAFVTAPAAQEGQHHPPVVHRHQAALGDVAQPTVAGRAQAGDDLDDPGLLRGDGRSIERQLCRRRPGPRALRR